MLLGHRYYDQSTGRFLSEHPAGDGANWYAYCENNPLTAVDPDGLTFVRSGWTDEQAKWFDKAVDYLRKDSEMRKVFDYLESEQAGDITVVFGEFKNYDVSWVHSDTKDRTIHWNPKMGGLLQYSETKEGKAGNQCAAMALGHEAGHMVEKIKRPDEFNRLRKTRDTRWRNMEERRVITGLEWHASKTLGEPIRTGYYGFPVPTADPLER